MGHKYLALTYSFIRFIIKFNIIICLGNKHIKKLFMYPLIISQKDIYINSNSGGCRTYNENGRKIIGVFI